MLSCRLETKFTRIDLYLESKPMAGKNCGITTQAVFGYPSYSLPAPPQYLGAELIAAFTCKSLKGDDIKTNILRIF